MATVIQAPYVGFKRVPHLESELSAKCKKFVVTHWGRRGLTQVKQRPVTWVRHQANPHLKVLRRQGLHLPLISVTGTTNRIYLHLSTEKRRSVSC